MFWDEKPSASPSSIPGLSSQPSPRSLQARFVKISLSFGTLSFYEVQVFDNRGTNRALGSHSTGSCSASIAIDGVTVGGTQLACRLGAAATINDHQTHGGNSIWGILSSSRA
jgi:hypothetical protein